MSATTKARVWCMERTQNRYAMPMKSLQAPLIKLHAARAGTKPNAGTGLAEWLDVAPLHLRVVPDGNVLELKVENPMDGHRLPIEMAYLV